MIPEDMALDVQAEVEALAEDIANANPHASVHLARIIEADERGLFRPFAEAVGARLLDHVVRCCELCAKGVPLTEIDIQEETYQLIRASAIDWDGLPASGRPGEEA